MPPEENPLLGFDGRDMFGFCAVRGVLGVPGLNCPELNCVVPPKLWLLFAVKPLLLGMVLEREPGIELL